MSEFTVTAAELETKAGELERLNNMLQQKISALESEEASLASMWEGEAHDAFSTSFKVNKAKMMLFHTEIQKYIASLRSIAAKYKVAEQTNVATASQR